MQKRTSCRKLHSSSLADCRIAAKRWLPESMQPYANIVAEDLNTFFYGQLCRVDVMIQAAKTISGIKQSEHAVNG